MDNPPQKGVTNLNIETKINVDLDANKLLDQISPIISIPTKTLATYLSPLHKYLGASWGMWLIEKLDKKAQQKGFDPREVKLAFGIPLIENAILETDENLQELWATLLFNASNKNFDESKIRTAFIDVIKGMSPIDSRIIQFMSDERNNRPRPTPVENVYYVKETMMNVLGISEKNYEISIYNLMRCQCVWPFQAESKIRVGSKKVATQNDINNIALTPFGLEFATACCSCP